MTNQQQLLLAYVEYTRYTTKLYKNDSVDYTAKPVKDLVETINEFTNKNWRTLLNGAKSFGYEILEGSPKKIIVRRFNSPSKRASSKEEYLVTKGFNVVQIIDREDDMKCRVVNLDRQVEILTSLYSKVKPFNIEGTREKVSIETIYANLRIAELLVSYEFIPLNKRPILNPSIEYNKVLNNNKVISLTDKVLNKILTLNLIEFSKSIEDSKPKDLTSTSIGRWFTVNSEIYVIKDMHGLKTNTLYGKKLVEVTKKLIDLYTESKLIEKSNEWSKVEMSPSQTRVSLSELDASIDAVKLFTVDPSMTDLVNTNYGSVKMNKEYSLVIKGPKKKTIVGALLELRNVITLHNDTLATGLNALEDKTMICHHIEGIAIKLAPEPASMRSTKPKPFVIVLTRTEICYIDEDFYVQNLIKTVRDTGLEKHSLVRPFSEEQFSELIDAIQKLFDAAEGLKEDENNIVFNVSTKKDEDVFHKLSKYYTESICDDDEAVEEATTDVNPDPCVDCVSKHVCGASPYVKLVDVSEVKEPEVKEPAAYDLKGLLSDLDDICGGISGSSAFNPIHKQALISSVSNLQNQIEFELNRIQPPTRHYPNPHDSTIYYTYPNRGHVPTPGFIPSHSHSPNYRHVSSGIDNIISPNGVVLTGIPDFNHYKITIDSEVIGTISDINLEWIKSVINTYLVKEINMIQGHNFNPPVSLINMEITPANGEDPRKFNLKMLGVGLVQNTHDLGNGISFTLV